jgi:uncharacterized protein
MIAMRSAGTVAWPARGAAAGNFSGTARHPCSIRLCRSIVHDGDFEWDDAKAAENLARHGVSFVAARLAFADVFAVVREDRRQKYGEDRFILIGMVEERLLAVAYAMRGERTRIISARLAEPRERRRYHEENR